MLPAHRLQVKPTHVLNAAGLTGRPNVDWCEDHKVSTCLPCCFRGASDLAFTHAFQSSRDNAAGPVVPDAAAPLAAQIETIRVNVLGMLNLADICFQKNLHLTTYATGVACMPPVSCRAAPGRMHVSTACYACMSQTRLLRQLHAAG